MLVNSSETGAKLSSIFRVFGVILYVFQNDKCFFFIFVLYPK